MEDKKMLEMIIGDNGIGLPGDFDLSNGRTMGLQLVDMLVCNQLGGKLAITGDNGTLYKIECNNVN
jgi:two-component sensor histidine kinase